MESCEASRFAPLGDHIAMNIGKVRLTVPVTVAPMEEHTNFPFRLLM
jgi:hypothetical protein